MLSKTQFDAFSQRIQPLVAREAHFHARRYGILEQEGDVANEAWLGLLKMTQAESFSLVDAEQFCEANLGELQDPAAAQHAYGVRRLVYNAARRFRRQQSKQAASFSEDLELAAPPAASESALRQIVKDVATALDGYTDLTQGNRDALNLEVMRCLDLTTKTLDNKERQALLRAKEKVMQRENDMTKRILNSLLVALSILGLAGSTRAMSHQGTHQIALHHQQFELHQQLRGHQDLLAHQDSIRHQGGIGHQVFDLHQSGVGHQVFDLHQGGIA